MLTEFIYQWNPFNLYGKQVEVEDLIRNPLQPTETLRQDSYGRLRRLNAPCMHSTLWAKLIFWLQAHLSQKGHLEAINKIISLFNETLLQDPPQAIEKLQEFNLKAEKLRSLKNDYGFKSLKKEEAYFIESRLSEIQQHAYSIFSQYHKQQALKKEDERKQAFMLFQEEIEIELERLDFCYREGLQKARLLLIAPSDLLQLLFEDRLQNLHKRIKTIQNFQQQIDQIEQLHQGKFTIPFLKEYLQKVRSRLCNELRKMEVEAEIVIGNLIINYRIAPSKEKVKKLLLSIKINPDEMHVDHKKVIPYVKELNREVMRIQRAVKFLFFLA